MVELILPDIGETTSNVFDADGKPKKDVARMVTVTGPRTRAAGALRIAMARIAIDAKIIGIIDADYVVEKNRDRPRFWEGQNIRTLSSFSLLGLRGSKGLSQTLGVGLDGTQ